MSGTAVSAEASPSPTALGDAVRVMGILNVTPDSFSDGGRYRGVDGALAHAGRMVAAGASIVDVGGESTRPGAVAVAVAEELDRVVPVVAAIRREFPVQVSVDTSSAQVMRAAVAAGADLINDVRALGRPGALEAAVELDVPVCLMHMAGEPATMQREPRYLDVVTEVREFLARRCAACLAAGVRREHLLVDPGFGFGKTLEHNLALLRRLGDIASLGFPLLVGLSRKAVIGDITGRAGRARATRRGPQALLAVQRGARVVRVHDVAETVDVLKLWARIESHDEGETG